MQMDLSMKEQVIRISIAVVVGIFIGMERKKKSKVAGIKTHSIITVICTMITMISIYGFNEYKIDPTRLLANLLTGVGFLCGGVIYVTTKHTTDEEEEEQETVVGLTTAAAIFGAAMLGIPIGAGYYFLVVVTLIAIKISLSIERIFNKIRRMIKSIKK